MIMTIIFYSEYDRKLLDNFEQWHGLIGVSNNCSAVWRIGCKRTRLEAGDQLGD